jgi:hypothetical protein
VVLFEANIENLRLPIIKSSPSIFDSDDTDENAHKQEPVLPAIQKYFEWSGTCETDGMGPSFLLFSVIPNLVQCYEGDGERLNVQHRFTLTKTGSLNSSSPSTVVRWTQKLVERVEPWFDKPEVHFSWS